MAKQRSKIEKFTDENKNIIYTLNKTGKKIVYFLNGYQAQLIKKISINGFDKLPSGLKRNGKGFASRGYLILRKLNEKFKNFDLIISKNQKTNIRKKKHKYCININHTDLQNILRELRIIGKEQWNLQNQLVERHLGILLPQKFKLGKTYNNDYQKDAISILLNKTKIFDNLSTTDIEGLSAFIPKFLEFYSNNLKGINKFIQISKNRDTTDIIYLENIIKEYERKLKSKSQDENRWQEFLRKYILVFNSNYAGIIEKKNISLEGKYPDFLLIDVYNYLDIFEIKKPNTNLLKYDKSRKNYYWDIDLSKAISQVENYIDLINKNNLAIQDSIKKSSKIDIKVVKPRGFIIAGTRKQLQDELMENNFRLLNNSMKNIEVILYDELFNNLKNFLKRLRKTKAVKDKK